MVQWCGVYGGESRKLRICGRRGSLKARQQQTAHSSQGSFIRRSWWRDGCRSTRYSLQTMNAKPVSWFSFFAGEQGFTRSGARACTRNRKNETTAQSAKKQDHTPQPSLPDMVGNPITLKLPVGRGNRHWNPPAGQIRHPFPPVKNPFNGKRPENEKNNLFRST